jgi:2-iminobutanoate/2-iminopropanoate deaminase
MGLTIKNYTSKTGTKQVFSRSVVAGNMIFCSGVNGFESETGKSGSKDVTTQTITALNKLKDTLKQSGSSINNIVRTTLLVKNMSDVSKVREAEMSYYKKNAPDLIKYAPASKVIQFHSATRPDSLLEIEAIAVLSRNTPGWEVKTYPLSYGKAKQTYAKAAVVGNLVYLSGLDARNFETGKIASSHIVDQVWATLENIKSALREVGTTMDSIVDTVMLLTDLRNYAAMRETEADFLQSHARRMVDDPPTSTFIKANSLSTPECLVEIQTTAVLSQDKPGWKVAKYPEWCGGGRAVIPYFPAGKPHLSKAAVVGDFIIGGGCAARTAKSEATIGTTIEEQMKVTLDVVKDTIEDAGGSMNNVIQTFALLKDIKDYPKMKKAELEYFKKYAPRLVEEPPVSTVIQPHSLARPDYLIEMDSLSFKTK